MGAIYYKICIDSYEIYLLECFTSPLKQACKKKNLLYRQFLKKRSVASEERYKRYKNKLTGILRYCGKKHFTELLEKNKGNIKETWKIINSLINKKSKGTTYPTEFNTSVAKILRLVLIIVL